MASTIRRRGPRTCAAARRCAPAPLTGASLVAGTFALSVATFMVVLDTSIANVSIPAISGDMAVSTSQGTWVITSFAVANAIAVPLTGWLAQRFGPVRLFTLSTLLFVLGSWLCGLATSIDMLIVFRVLQGLVAGPLIPLSQALLLSSYPRSKSGMALAMWSMTTLVAPVAGPLLGGWITDNYSWPWIFYINIPVGILAVWLTWSIYRHRESPTRKLPIDKIGLALLVIWIGALQIMLDKGKDLDWFGSSQIVTLAVVAGVGFVFFLIWELNEEHPVVDLRLFAGRNFAMGTLCLGMAYGVFFANVVILPLWLQTQLNYTATDAGYVLAPVGFLAILLSPVIGRMVGRVDQRLIASVSFVLFALISYMRSRFNAQVDMEHADDPDHNSGCRRGVLLHTAGVDRAVRAPAGQDPERQRPLQLRADHRGRLRHVDLDHALGQPCRDAPRASRRVDQLRKPRRDAGIVQPSGIGNEPRAEHRDDRPHHQRAGLRAGGRRHLLCLDRDLPAADSAAVVHASAEEQRARRRRRALTARREMRRNAALPTRPHGAASPSLIRSHGARRDDRQRDLVSTST